MLPRSIKIIASLYSFSLFVLVCSFVLNAQTNPNFTIRTNPLPSIGNKDSVVEISLSFVGDLMCHKPQTNNALQKDGTYDFKPSFAYVKKYLSEADFTMGNIETTFAGKEKPYAGYPAFNSPDEYVEAIKDAGIDFFSNSKQPQYGYRRRWHFAHH
jgi:hypothetical protein